MADIFKGVLPFWAAMLVCAGLLIAFPDIALFLPETMIR
jgi:TRAP-type mannitol/chloroaromatic compound transport system permease large subunit